jgi:hypothetical protein
MITRVKVCRISFTGLIGVFDNVRVTHDGIVNWLSLPDEYCKMGRLSRACGGFQMGMFEAYDDGAGTVDLPVVDGPVAEGPGFIITAEA